MIAPEPVDAITSAIAEHSPAPRESEALGGDDLVTIGDRRILGSAALALFGSRRFPGDLILPALDLARQLRTQRVIVAAGFQSRLERCVLRLLLKGSQQVIVCPARQVREMRLPGDWSAAVAGGRMLVVGRRSERERRPTAQTTAARDRLVADLAAVLFIVHGHAGSRTYRTAANAVKQGKAVFCFDHPANRDLFLIGARPIPIRV